MYRFDHLRTGTQPGVAEHNAKLLGDNTFGIEVTIEVMAKQCGLGNIDPQHQLNGHSAAVTAVMALKDDQLPPDGATVVTIRVDRDALCAMAVLDLLKQGRRSNMDADLIEWIGALDNGFENAKSKYPDLAVRMQNDRRSRAIVTIVKDDFWQDVPAKVETIAKVLTGELNLTQVEDLVRSAPIQELPDFVGMARRIGKDRKVGFVEAPGYKDQARNALNDVFDVGIVFDPKRRTQSGGLQASWTVVRKQGCFDRAAFVKAINEAESEARGMYCVDELISKGWTWGGPPNIVTSPQGEGVGTHLREDQILDLVVAHYESGKVS